MFDAKGNPIGTVPTPSTTAPPRIGGQPSFGAGGTITPPGGAGRGYTSVPGNIPGGTMGGGGSPIGGGGGMGGNWKQQLIPAGASILGQIFNYFGNKRQTDAQNRNNEAATAQARADAEARARAGSGIYSQMLAQYGRSDLATPEQIYAALMRPPTPTVKVAGPSIFNTFGKTAEDIGAGASDYYATKNRNQPPPADQTQSEVWKAILELIFNRNNQSPVGGGSSISPDWQD